MIFYIHIIFQPFRSFIHVIYLQNFIIHLQMDPGRLVINSTLLMSFDVGKSRISEFLTMRDRTKEELAALCFSACKLNLPLVPSQDNVLKDNKRCYDNILKNSEILDFPTSKLIKSVELITSRPGFICRCIIKFCK
jgi:hypothetical protein